MMTFRFSAQRKLINSLREHFDTFKMIKFPSCRVTILNVSKVLSIDLLQERFLTMSKTNKRLITFRLHPELIQKIDETRSFYSLGARTTFLETAAKAYIHSFKVERAGYNGAE